MCWKYEIAEAADSKAVAMYDNKDIEAATKATPFDVVLRSKL
jgi:hypothetical protein